MFSTLYTLVTEAKKLAEEQSSDFQDTLTYVTENSIDPQILALINIVLQPDEQRFEITTRI